MTGVNKERIQEGASILKDEYEDLGASSLQNFCRRNDIGRSKAYQEIKDGHLRIRKVGRRTIVTRKDERRWLDALPEGGPTGSAIEKEGQ